MPRIATCVFVEADARAVFEAFADVERLGRPPLRVDDYPFGASLLVERMPQGLELRLCATQERDGTLILIEVANEVRPRIVRRGGPSDEALGEARRKAADLARDVEDALQRRALAARWAASRDLALGGHGAPGFEGFEPARTDAP
jgi:hypothetical protein